MLKLRNMEKFNDAKANFINAVKEGKSKEEQGQAYASMIDGLAEGVMDEARKAAREESEAVAGAKDSRLNAEQRKFFNEINTEVGFEDEVLLPETTINQIFEDLVSEHPLLNAVGIFNAGPRVKFLRAETSGVIVWGKIFGEIKGQLDAAFSDDTAIQDKATAFVVVPKDLKDLSVDWIERFVRLQITEAFALGLELAFLTGDGKDKPVGLNRQVGEGVAVVDGVHPVKTAVGTLTIDKLAIGKENLVEMSKIKKHHATKEDGKRLNTAGKLYLVVSPEDAVDLDIAFTSVANGVYVRNTPYNIQIVESEAQDTGKVLSFVKGRYDAAVGGGVTIRKYDQTLALEDMDLYTAKQFAFGKAKDEKAAAIWTLDVTGETIPAG